MTRQSELRRLNPEVNLDEEALAPNQVFKNQKKRGVLRGWFRNGSACCLKTDYSIFGRAVEMQ